MTIKQAEDKVQCLSTAHCIVSATCIGHMQVTTDMLVMVHNQSDAIDMKPFQPTTDDNQCQCHNRQCYNLQFTITAKASK